MRCGSRAGSRIRTARAGSRASSIAVADVDEAAARFARFTHGRRRATRAGQAVQLDRGRIDLVTRDAFAAALPEIAIPSLPFIGAYGVTVTSLDAVEATLRARRPAVAPRGRCRWSRRFPRSWATARGCSARTAHVSLPLISQLMVRSGRAVSTMAPHPSRRAYASKRNYFANIPCSRSTTAGGVA